MTYRVVAPYVTVKVPDASGKVTVNGFYRDGVLPSSADLENVKILVRKGMVEKVSMPETEPAVEPAPEPEPEVEAETEESPSRPPQNAPKAEWVAYAESQGFNRDEAEAMSKADLIDTFGG